MCLCELEEGGGAQAFISLDPNMYFKPYSDSSGEKIFMNYSAHIHHCAKFV